MRASSARRALSLACFGTTTSRFDMPSNAVRNCVSDLK
jgi:hypothetical protein